MDYSPVRCAELDADLASELPARGHRRNADVLKAAALGLCLATLSAAATAPRVALTTGYAQLTSWPPSILVVRMVDPKTGEAAVIQRLRGKAGKTVKLGSWSRYLKRGDTAIVYRRPGRDGRLHRVKAVTSRDPGMADMSLYPVAHAAHGRGHFAPDWSDPDQLSHHITFVRTYLRLAREPSAAAWAAALRSSSLAARLAARSLMWGMRRNQPVAVWDMLCPALVDGFAQDPHLLLGTARERGLETLGRCIRASVRLHNFTPYRHPAWWDAAARLLLSEASKSPPWDVPGEACETLSVMGMPWLPCPANHSAPVSPKILAKARATLRLAPPGASAPPSAQQPPALPAGPKAPATTSASP